MWTDDLFRPFKNWLAETGVMMLGVLIISIIALYVEAIPVPQIISVFYMTGAVSFGVLFGRIIERWSRSRQ